MKQIPAWIWIFLTVAYSFSFLFSDSHKLEYLILAHTSVIMSVLLTKE